MAFLRFVGEGMEEGEFSEVSFVEIPELVDLRKKLRENLRIVESLLVTDSASSSYLHRLVRISLLSRRITRRSLPKS